MGRKTDGVVGSVGGRGGAHPIAHPIDPPSHTPDTWSITRDSVDRGCAAYTLAYMAETTQRNWWRQGGHRPEDGARESESGWMAENA